MGAGIKNYLGNLGITGRQLYRIQDLKGPSYLDFDFIDGEIFVYAPKELSADEKETLAGLIRALPDTPLPREQEKVDFQNHPLRGLTPDQARQWVRNTAVDPASTRDVLEKLAAGFAFLLRRTGAG